MMQAKQPIGVIDSGVGGLTVLKWLQAKLPHEDFIFIGDTARTPYGNRSREEITRFVAEMTDWLDKRHIKQLVVACNTITVLGLDVIKGNHPFDVIGMAKGSRMVPGVTKNNRVGFFATDFTVSTGAHKREIQRICPEIQVFGQGCPKFVPLIEGEKFGSPELKAAIHEYADKLREHHVDTVLLSCTHYPFVRKEIEEEFGPEVTILDPMFLEFMELISPWRGNDRCPTGPEQGNIPYDDLAAHLTGFGHLRTGYRFVGLFEHGQDSIPPFFVFHGSSPPCS